MGLVYDEQLKRTRTHGGARHEARAAHIECHRARPLVHWVM